MFKTIHLLRKLGRILEVMVESEMKEKVSMMFATEGAIPGRQR
jgi:hypothetical protein